LETRDQLTALEQKLVHKAWSRASQTLVLAHVRDVGIRLRGLDLQRLRHPNWLHDEIVNAYMGILNRRYRQHGVYCFNSFFYTRLVNPSYRFEFVRRWTTRAGLCIQRDSLLLIPVNLDQRHWILVAIDAAHRELRCYDSMHTRDGWRVLPNLKQWLLDELADKQIQDPWLLRDDWRAVLTHEVQTLPRQRDRGSCGVFSLLFAEALASSWSAKHADSRSQSKSNCCRFPFDQHDIPLLRMRIVLALLQQCPEM
jgi:Ulp1 family protease